MKCAECGGDVEQFSNDIVVIGSLVRCNKCNDKKLLTEHSKYNDPVTKPIHYNWHPSGVECKTIAEAFCYNLGCAIKYIWRAGRKGDVIEDLKKAQEHIKNEIERLERKENQ